MTTGVKWPQLKTLEEATQNFQIPLSRRNSQPVQYVNNVCNTGSTTGEPGNQLTSNTLLSVTTLPTHKSISRCHSEPVDQKNNRYKTELCRPYEEAGDCKYGDKCQFAHGRHELRGLERHPKYKTELCRTYHTTSFCPYGPRCHFVHDQEEQTKSQEVHNNNMLNNMQLQDTQYVSQQPPLVRDLAPRPKALTVGYSLNSIGSESPSPPSSLSDSPTSISAFSFGGDDLSNAFSNHTGLFSPSAATSNNNRAYFFDKQDININLPPLNGYSRESVNGYQHSNGYSPNSDLEFKSAVHHSNGYTPNTNVEFKSAVHQSNGFSPNSDIDFKSSILSIPSLDAPPSPVDSVASELECLTLSSGSQLSASPPTFVPQYQSQQSNTLIEPLSPVVRGDRLPIFRQLEESCHF